MRTRCGGSARRGPRRPAGIATSSCAACATGAGVQAGATAPLFTVAADAYGVIVRYAASLAGVGPQDHGACHRAACLAFTAASLPFQFLPLAMALAGKCARAANGPPGREPACWRPCSRRRRRSGPVQTGSGMRHRVAITGIGLVTALGATRETSWRA